MLLGHVGAQDHYEYRAVGDIVNTATRIEGLNKYLGTRILASGTVLEGLSGFLTRDVGTFQLKGKSRAIKICEILCTIEAAEVSQQELIKIFSTAMDAFREERWEDAKVFFQECLSLNHADGPSRYYLELCESYTTGLSRPDSAGVIVMAKK
jgi:adenylate cyclase